jgi:ATP-dependent exoDNAse (exonuclease V) beta subunit
VAEKLFTIPDLAARTTALTAIDRSLLVEAGAGSGKTSVMAGRVAVLLASGIAPKHIAAITFTEFAASELLIRIDRFVQALAKKTVPPDLESAFSVGISKEQLKNLEEARRTLDQLTCTTIHGFAQALIKPYPVDATIDPGADIVDPAEADLAFNERFEAWLKEQLSDAAGDGIVAELVLCDEKKALALVREVAQFLKTNRDARPTNGLWQKSVVRDFADCVKAFGKQFSEYSFSETETVARHEAFTALTKILASPELAKGLPSVSALIGVLRLPAPDTCFTQSGAVRQLNTKGKWEKAAAAAGQTRPVGAEAHAAVDEIYQQCHATYAALTSAAAGELLVRLVSLMDGLMKQWRDYKRAAALLDFDDLLYTARDLLRRREPVRQALANRFRHVLVDEFQDTDPLQIDILWRLCGEPATDGDKDPLARQLRPGALFLVGDPKQAIYRFRGADVNAYVAARAAIGEKSILKITANFRSVKPILDFVNATFAIPLSQARGQPGFTELSSTCDAPKKTMTVAAIDVDTDVDKPTATMLRDAEAGRIAELCNRLVGNWTVRDQKTKKMRPCGLGDIALLAPVGTDLWRFEEALEDLGIPVSTQAGKGFFRRQEIHDLIALTRTLADSRDTLALGALLRGPLVGLTETELLDIVEGLPVDPQRPDRLQILSLWTPPEQIGHEVARTVIEKLQSLGRGMRSTTPYMLLTDAVSALNVRSQLRQRFKAGAERALANIDLYLEMARGYDVRGLRAFARDMRANWDEAVRQVEGRPDAEEHSVALITIHAAKGLEWPIVIPVNMTGTPTTETGIMHDRRSGRFSISVLDVEPRAYGFLKAQNEQEQARERVRLWYVAATRARDLLVLPRHVATLPDKSWTRTVDLDLPSLPALDPHQMGNVKQQMADTTENAQTRAIFTAEAARIAKAQRKITWKRPSRSESENPEVRPTPIFNEPDAVDETIEIEPLDVAGGATRGTILHKLMEEVLTGETLDDASALTQRATQFLSQLGVAPSADPKLGISPSELAETIARTLRLPQIAALRPRLVPEQTVYGHLASADGDVLISGIADAVVANDNGQAEVVIDWKSDVMMPMEKFNIYRSQLETYRKQTGAARALLVLMTPGKIIELKPRPSTTDYKSGSDVTPIGAEIISDSE